MENKKPSEQWVMGYKELKNFIHNEQGISNAEIQEILHKMAFDQLREIIGENGQGIRNMVKEIVHEELLRMISGSRWDFPNNNRTERMRSLLSDQLKEVIGELVKEQLEVSYEIKLKPEFINKITSTPTSLTEVDRQPAGSGTITSNPRKGSGVVYSSVKGGHNSPAQG